MRRSARGKFSEDELDREIQGHVTTARRAVGRAVDVCVRVRRGEPRHVNRAAYTQLMDLLAMTERIRSAVPTPLDDPDMYPEELTEQVFEIESCVRHANAALRVAADMLRRAEDSFNSVDATFAAREIEAVEDTETEVRRLLVSLESFRGLRPNGKPTEEEPIRRGKQRNEPRVRRTVQVPARPDPAPVGE